MQVRRPFFLYFYNFKGIEILRRLPALPDYFTCFTIKHTFVNLGKIWHNMAESLVNTTILTTKAHKQNGIKAKVLGAFPSSKRLLRKKLMIDRL